jgi:hypothetical protein
MTHDIGTNAPHRILTSLLCTALFTALACGSGDSGPAEAPAAEAAPPPSASAPAPSEPAAEPTISSGELHANYPSDLPVYPGAAAGTSLSVPGAALMATFESEDATGTITDYLKNALAEKGWAVSNQDAETLEATKTSRTAIFRVSDSDGGGSTIVVTVTGG